MIVQVVGFASGLLFIRCMTQTEYAYYTIANTMQGSMNVLADMGIGIGVSALGGRVWQDRFQLGQVIQTAISLRKKLALGAAVAVIPFFLYFLLHQRAPFIYALLLILIVLCSLTSQLSASVLIAVPRFHAQISRLQRLDLTVSLVKLLLVAVLCSFWMNSAIALCIGSITVALPLLFLKPWAKEFADLSAFPNPAFRGEMTGIIKSQAPNAFFYCIQGQITVWLIGFFGKVQGVAEIGALGRLAVAFSIISSVMVTVVVPRFARCHEPKIVIQRYCLISLVLLILSFSVVVLAILYTPQCLWLLGPKYQHLHTEFILCLISTVLGFFIGSLWSLNAARAWIHKSWLYIPATLVVQIGLIPLLDLSKVREVLIFGILSQVPSLILNLYMSHKGFRTEFRGNTLNQTLTSQPCPTTLATPPGCKGR